MTHEERIELAGRLRDLILERYGDSVLAIFITSSTARGLDPGVLGPRADGREHLEILLRVRWAAAETFAAASEDLTNELIQFAATRGIDVESEELLV